jgi:hypothetical protein
MSSFPAAVNPGQRNRGLRVCWIAVFLLISASWANAALWDPFSGFIDLSAVQAQVNDLDQETLRQEYNVAFTQSLAPWVDLRLAMRYYKFDQELELLLGGYREEFQPSGELRWNHGLFNLTTSAFRREVTTSARGLIVTKDFQSSLRTVDQNYPVVELRYDQQHTYSPQLEEDWDIKNSRVQANVDYRPGQHDFNYSFSHIRSQNVISSVSAHVNRHLFRWAGAGRVLEGGRLSLSGRYSFNYASQTNKTTDGGPVLELAPIAVGLYSLDFAPDLGRLDPRPELADGNKVDPVIPLIDIGGGGNGHNLGADLGFTQAVAGIYIYTDRPSGSQPRWDVYGSADNLTWQLLGTPSQFFNPALNRYELTFSAAPYRYIKAVNSGLNEIALVHVTEIEVLRELPPETDKTNFASSSHTLDGRAAYRISDRWETSLDASLQADENIGRRGDRNRWALGGRLLFEQSPKLSHHLRLDLSRQGGQTPQPILVDSGIGYTMMFDPLQTLRGSFSLSDRLNYQDGSRSQNILSSVLEGNATVLPDLDLSLGGGVSWFDDYIILREFRTWHARGGIDAAVFRSLDFILDYNYQETHEERVAGRRVRRFTDLGLEWRVTRDVYARATLRSTKQSIRVWTQDYLVSWNVLPSVRVSAQFYEILEDDNTTSLRKSANLNWTLGARSTLYFRLAEVDFSGTGGARTVSFQQGFRWSF